MSKTESMTPESSIAVIISTYNSPDYLRRVLDAYMHQTRLPDELIVADDGSTRETADVVEEFRGKAPFHVGHVWHEDLGFRAAKIRNEAVKVCRGDYLVFSDGDCIPHRTFVADHATLAQRGYFVQGKRMLVREGASATFAPSFFVRLAVQCLKREISGFHHLVRIPGLAVTKHGLRGIKTCNLAVHRDAVLAINGFNEAFVGWGREDSEFAARLFAYGLKRKDPPFSALVFHLCHPENSRGNLADNDHLLKSTVESNIFRCPCGIDKQ
jgi:glycosyltransferase involved in cell wall biosynthesis